MASFFKNCPTCGRRKINKYQIECDSCRETTRQLERPKTRREIEAESCDSLKSFRNY